MTWTKLGDEFSDECANTGLSDAAFRTHAEAIAWLYRVEMSDLKIAKILLRRFAGSEDWENAVQVLVALGWWRERDDHYQVVHHADVVRQSLAAQQAKRIRDKKAQADKRRRDDRKGSKVSDGVSADVIPDTDRQTDKALTGSRDLPNPAQFWKQPHEMATSSSPTLGLDRLPGRCPSCAFHVATQGHGEGCSERQTG